MIRQTQLMMILHIIVAITLAAIVAITIRLTVVLRQIWRHRQLKSFLVGYGRTKHRPVIAAVPPLKTLIILGSGGHTTELLTITRTLESQYYNPILYCKASTDTTSLDRLQTFWPLSTSQPIVYDIPRSREVGQSYISSVLTTLWAFGASLSLVHRLSPDLILCNGPGTCLPICWAAFCFRWLGWKHSTIVFVESFCRVQSLSLTGKILYYTIADLVLLHWPSLQQKYPHSLLTSAIIRNDKG